MSNDLEVLLEAARLLQDFAIQIVLVGDGKEKPGLVAQATLLGIDNILFLPAVPKREMPAVLAGADAGIAILRPIEAYKTTYPNKVFDYMAAGRPVLLAIDGVIREVVEAAECGLFVKPGDPVALAQAARTLASDPELARRMGMNGKAYLEQHFSRDKIAGHLIEVLQVYCREEASRMIEPVDLSAKFALFSELLASEDRGRVERQLCQTGEAER